MATVPFNAKKLLELLDADELSPSEVRRALKKATQLGLYVEAKRFSEYLVQGKEFAPDASSRELKEKVAKGISLLKGLGYHPNRTEQKLRRKGVITTLNDIALKVGVSANFKRMIAANYYEYTTEAIVVEFAQFFTKEAVEASKEKLKPYQK